MKYSKADVVGGIVVTEQNGEGIFSKIVQLISTHWFGVGNATFRLKTKARFVDTVPFGFFNKSIFDKAGYFDERLIRNQDYEFNQRVIKLGGRIWLDPAIMAFYKNQSTFRGLLKQALFTGKWNTWMWRLAPYSFKPRHAIPGLFVIVLISLIILSPLHSAMGCFFIFFFSFYFFCSICASVQQSFRYRSLIMTFVLPFCFFTYHLTYGIGIIGGILRLVIGKSDINISSKPWTGAPNCFAIHSCQKVL